MTFHNLQNSLIYRLKTQEITFQRLKGERQAADPLARSRAANDARTPVLNNSLRDCCTPSVIKWYRFFAACFFVGPLLSSIK